MKVVFLYCLIFCGLLTGAMFVGGCATQRVSVTMVTYDQQLLNDADYEFEQKKFVHSFKLYKQIRDQYYKSTVASAAASARQAQYKMGLILIYSENPAANWKSALAEFKTYAKRYPSGEHIGEVNSLIRILVAMQSFEDQYKIRTNKLDDIKLKYFQSQEEYYNSIENLQRRFAVERDSLVMEIKKREDALLKIENTR